MEKEMEKEVKSSRGASAEPDFILQWGNRKRLRCVKVSDEGSPAKSVGRRRRVNCRIVVDKDTPSLPPPQPPSHHHQNHRKSESVGSENGKRSRSLSMSPEKDRFYATRGSAAALSCEGENGAKLGVEREERMVQAVTVLPRFFVSLSNKEKEEDFMAMKGCKLPQRPKKRSKFMQKCILLVSPGAWLSDLSHERYEVREKRNSKKRRRGLKAMTLESDSE